jgi:hypothetical protein
MKRLHWAFAVGILLATTSGVEAQIVRGVMSVTQTHMS